MAYSAWITQCIYSVKDNRTRNMAANENVCVHLTSKVTETKLQFLFLGDMLVVRSRQGDEKKQCNLPNAIICQSR